MYYLHFRKLCSSADTRQFAKDLASWLHEYRQDGRTTSSNISSDDSISYTTSSRTITPASGKADNKIQKISGQPISKKAVLAALELPDVARGTTRKLTEDELLKILKITSGWELCKRDYDKRKLHLQEWAKNPRSFWGVSSETSYSDLIGRCHQVIVLQNASSQLQQIRGRLGKTLMSQEIKRIGGDQLKDIAMERWFAHHGKLRSNAIPGEEFVKFYKIFAATVNKGMKLALLGCTLLFLPNTTAYEKKMMSDIELRAVGEYAHRLVQPDARARLNDTFWKIMDCSDIQKATFQQTSREDIIVSISSANGVSPDLRKRPAQDDHEYRGMLTPSQLTLHNDLTLEEQDLTCVTDFINLEVRPTNEGYESLSLSDITDHVGFLNTTNSIWEDYNLSDDMTDFYVQRSTTLISPVDNVQP